MLSGRRQDGFPFVCAIILLLLDGTLLSSRNINVLHHVSQDLLHGHAMTQGHLVDDVESQQSEVLEGVVLTASKLGDTQESDTVSGSALAHG